MIGLLGVLFGLLLPAVQSARGAAERAACQNNLRQVGIGLHNFHAAHGRFPPKGAGDGKSILVTRSPDILLGWMAHILPHVDQASLWESSEAACRTGAKPNENPPHIGNSTPIPTYVCRSGTRLLRPLTTPSGHTVAYASYIGVAGANWGPNGPHSEYARGMLSAIPGTRLTEATDGASQTVMVGERPPPASIQAGQWYSRGGGYNYEPFAGPDDLLYLPMGALPEDPCGSGSVFALGPGRLDNPCDRKHFWSLHRGGANFLFADGAVRFLPYSARELLPALATRAGGEVVAVPD